MRATPRTTSSRAPRCASTGQSGYEDTKRTLKRRDWIKMPDEGMGLVVHDVHRETESA